VFVNVSMPHKIAYYPEKQEYQLQTGKGLRQFFGSHLSRFPVQ